jgi:hypothetical protein
VDRKKNVEEVFSVSKSHRLKVSDGFFNEGNLSLMLIQCSEDARRQADSRQQ